MPSNPKTYVFCNSKGGVGKTTASLLLALNLKRHGFKVCILDLDTQQKSSFRRGPQLELEVVLSEDRIPECQILIIDTPPHITSEGLRSACSFVQSEEQGRVVLTMTPSLLDLEATMEAVSELGILNNPAARLLFNRVSTNTSFGKNREVFAQSLAGVKPLAVFLKRRSCYEQAVVSGMKHILKLPDALAELEAFTHHLIVT